MLKECPCGKTPKELVIYESSSTCKYYWVGGDCCNDWHIEFRTDYHDADSPECMELAIRAWNDAPRGKNEWRPIEEYDRKRDGEEILCKGEAVYYVAYWRDCKGGFEDICAFNVYPTHFCRIPEFKPD